MSLEQITDLFKWMTIINIGVLLFSSFMIMLLKGAVYKLHGSLFGLKEEAVAALCYGYLGILKIAVIVFNLVPWIALNIIKN